jgi:TrmH family RNA methyltransferase
MRRIGENVRGAPTAPAVVLVRPREEGNVGAAARAMANMGLSRLILVEPAAPIDKVARAFAVGGRPILDGCQRAASLREALAPFARVVATTSSRDRQTGAVPIAPAQLPALLAQDPPGTAAALVFGPEVGGLTNDELAQASLLVTIPCAPALPTLNLAQAVLILAYELHLASNPAPADSPAGWDPAVSNRPPGRDPADTDGSHMDPAPPAATGELDGLFDQLTPLLARIGFARDSTFSGVLRDLRQLAARAGPTRREVAILRGICRRAHWSLVRRGTDRGG